MVPPQAEAALTAAPWRASNNAYLPRSAPSAISQATASLVSSMRVGLEAGRDVVDAALPCPVAHLAILTEVDARAVLTVRGLLRQPLFASRACQT